MATTNLDTDVQIKLSGVSPKSVRRPKPEDPYKSIYPASSRDWWLCVYNKRTGRLVDVSEAVTSASWTEDLETIVISGSADFSNVIDDNGHRASHYIRKGSELRTFVRNPNTGNAEEKDRFVVWQIERSSDTKLTVQFYSYEKYLADSNVTVLYHKRNSANAPTVGEITKSICKTYGVKIGSLPKSRHRVQYFYQETQPLLDVLIRLWTLESKATGRKFTMSIKRGRLYIRRKTKKPRSWVLELSSQGPEAGILQSASHTESLDGMVTSVRLWGTRKDYSSNTTDTRRAVVKSKWYTQRRKVALYGRIYLEEVVQGVTNQGDIDKQAKKKLKRLARETWGARAELVGYPYISAGQAVRVYEPESGLNGLYWFKNLTHSVGGDGSYSASGELIRYNYTKELATEPTDLKPDNPNQNTVGGVGSPVNKHTNAIPRNVWLVIRAAARRAKVPESWANSKDLEKLLQHESTFSFTAQNRSSTAYGLFQFLDSTWSTVDIPKSRCVPGALYNGQSSVNIEGIGRMPYWQYWQCVAGLKYIKNRYGNPSKAWAVWQKNSPHSY